MTQLETNRLLDTLERIAVALERHNALEYPISSKRLESGMPTAVWNAPIASLEMFPKP